MAIRKRNGRFQVYWNNPFTKRRESKTVLDKREAEKLDAQIKYRLQFEREEFRPAAGETVEEAPAAQECTVEEIHYLYLKEKQFGKKQIYCQLSAMRPAYTAFAGVPASEITPEKLEAYKRDLLQTKVKPTTVRAKLSKLRTVLRWAQRNGIIEDVPRFPALPPADYEHFVPPSPGELARMIDVAPEHIRRIIILGAQTGARVGPSELFRLRWQDVDTERQIIRMPSSEKNKREPWREIPIRASLEPVLAAWRDADAALGIEYVIHWRQKPVDDILNAWQRMLKRAGITRRIRPYDLRHYFATEAIAAGVDLGAVANLMGHRGTAMLIEHYQHVLTRQKKAAVEALPDVPACAKGHVPGRNEAGRERTAA